LQVLSVSRRGDGLQRVVRLDEETAARPLVVKHYGRQRGRVRSLLRAFGHRALVGKSTNSPRGRMQVERRLLDLWRSSGFDVPELRPLPDDACPDLSPDRVPTLALEWIDGVTLGERLEAAGTDERRALVTRLGGELARRQDHAVGTGDRRLILEHPSCDHVLLSGDRFVTFDLEIAYVWGRSVECLAARECAGFLYSAAKCCAGGARDARRAGGEDVKDGGGRDGSSDEFELEGIVDAFVVGYLNGAAGGTARGAARGAARGTAPDAGAGDFRLDRLARTARYLSGGRGRWNVLRRLTGGISRRRRSVREQLARILRERLRM